MLSQGQKIQIISDKTSTEQIEAQFMNTS